MIERILEGYRTGELLRSEMFLGLLRCTQEVNWRSTFDALSIDDKEHFREWAVPLATRELTLVIAEMDPLTEAVYEGLKSRCTELGWIE